MDKNNLEPTNSSVPKADSRLCLKPSWVAPSAYPTYLVYVGRVSGEATPPDNNDELIQLTALVETIEKGNNLPWRCPWVKKGFSGLPFNFSTNDPYSGINILLLWCAAAEREFSCNAWLTFKQAQALDAKVRKGEKSVRCVFYKPLEIEDENAEDGKKVIPMLKPFNLFNLDQIDGLTLPELDFSSEVAGNETTQYFELFANR